MRGRPQAPVLAALVLALLPIMSVPAVCEGGGGGGQDAPPKGSEKTSVGPAKGSLVVVGGGMTTPEICRRFVALAGGTEAHFVLIPTADEDRGTDSKRLEERFATEFGVKNVAVLHTRDRKVADSEDFTAPLRTATGVWFGGGRQWRLTDAYLDTRTEREIRAVLDRGGVIGGTSAGATIQGSYLVRGDPKGNTVMMSKGHEKGFGYLQNVAVDQHVIARQREKDLSEVIKAHPELLGIGIDESTAIVVQGDRFEVIGRSKVLITDGREHAGVPYYLLAPHDRFNLKTRTVESGVEKERE